MCNNSLPSSIVIISAGIRIIQIAAHAVIIPVKCQRFCLVAEVAVFGEEGRRYHAVVPCPQVLALDIRIVGLSVIGIFVLILRSPEGDLSGDAVTVGLVDLSFFIMGFSLLSASEFLQTEKWRCAKQ